MRSSRGTTRVGPFRADRSWEGTLYDWVESQRHGYGTRAFHYLWYLLVASHARRSDPVRVLEIGVFKGQVLSLASLAARELDVPILATGVSPLTGNQEPLPPWRAARKFLFDSRWRAQYLLGNLHPAGDHLAEIRRIYDAFALDLRSVKLLRGLSTDSHVVDQLRQNQYTIVFIDGDHSESVLASISKPMRRWSSPVATR